MRVNLYTEEFKRAQIEVVRKVSPEGIGYRGLRIYITTPITMRDSNGIESELRGKWFHSAEDDDTSAVTFWGLRTTCEVLERALDAARRELAEAGERM